MLDGDNYQLWRILILDILDKLKIEAAVKGPYLVTTAEWRELNEHKNRQEIVVILKDSRRSRSPDRYRRSRRSRSPPRHRPSSPSRYRSSHRRHDRNEDQSPPRRRSRERSQHTTRPTQERLHQPRVRSRSRSPVKHKDHTNNSNNRDQSPPPPSKDNETSEATDEALQQMTEEEQMNALLGFGGFSTTKGKAVAGNNVGAANVKKQRKFRQYMNRKGGFNRLLDK
ncbi:hypothetical protein GGH94_002130 [Coemansia aciculifera]|uniref:U4/U6.U5 small nuclear ribonucleoprotein 27kDa protein domain-containing protein n=1 Tax=Coemansia aciculifera TaxID=417176 RepID=A0A9W8M7G9_9FUNG|nr:hypothetical protein GGH94_002130 [Coemansia aciculifera]